jgi:hypothetical protein
LHIFCNFVSKEINSKIKRLMKKLFIVGVILISITFSGCIIIDQTCVVCDIYDKYGNFVKDYGEYCGSMHKARQYADDADQHAWDYYDGYANCYYD